MSLSRRDFLKYGGATATVPRSARVSTYAAVEAPVSLKIRKRKRSRASPVLRVGFGQLIYSKETGSSTSRATRTPRTRWGGLCPKVRQPSSCRTTR